MKKALFIFLLTLFHSIVSCKQNSDKDLSKILKKEKKTITTQSLTCLEIVEKIVKSSNLNLKVYKNYFINIDNIKDDSISIHVYFENNLSDDPKQKQIVESTIAWLLLFPNKQKLYNVTNDPDNPIELIFDKNILTYNDIFQACRITETSTNPKDDIEYKTAVLPFDFEKFYAACVYPYDEKKCNEDYPKYDYNKKSKLFKITGDKFYFSENIYLPKINGFQPILLCDNTSDVENYYLIVIKDQKIISDLLIGKMDGESIQNFNITKEYTIILYKAKNANDPKKEIGRYKISDNGSIIKL